MEADPYLTQHPEATPRLNAALAEVQKVMKAAKKDSVNPFFSTPGKQSLYADLGSVLEACLPHLVANGLSVAQTASNDVNGVTIITHLRHVSGECLSSPFWVPVVKKDPQGYGSASTYARRFGLQALVGLAAEADDDGNSHRVDPKAKTAADYTKPKTPKPADARSPEAIAEDAHAATVDKLVKAFAGYGKTPAQLEELIGKSLCNATEADFASLKEYGKKLKALASESPEQLAKRLEAEKAEAGIAAEQAKKSGKDPRFVAFEALITRFRAAKSSAEVTLIHAEAAKETLFTDGDRKALQRSAADRSLILDDALRAPRERKLTINDRSSDVPL